MAVVIESSRTVFPQIIGGHYHIFPNQGYFVERPEGRDDWLLLITLGGFGRIHAGERPFRLEREAVALFPPGVTQGYRAWPGETWDFLWVHFFPANDWFRRGLLELPPADFGRGVRLLELREAVVPTRRRVRQTFLECVDWAAQDNAFGDTMAMNLLERALLFCSREARGEGLAPKDNGFVREARAFLARQCDRPLTTEALAAHFHMSVSHFSHRFRAAFGMAPMAYVEHCRLERAKRLILAGLCATVKAAALDAGFADPGYFSRRFRKRYGVAPSDFIAKQAAEARKTS